MTFKNIPSDFTSKNGKIKLSPSEKDNLLSLMPPPGDVICHDRIYSLEGRHYPCYTSILPNLFEKRRMMKTFDAKNVYVDCMADDESTHAKNQINNFLEKFDFSASTLGTTLKINLPEHATGHLLYLSDGFPIYCTEEHGAEKIIFGLPDKKNLQDLKEEFSKHEKIVSDKYDVDCEYPHEFHLLKKEVFLPSEVWKYNNEFIYLLMGEKFTDRQTRTAISLYEMGLQGADFTTIVERDVINIVAKHSGNPVRTVENHLFTGRESSLERKIHGLLANLLSINTEFFVGRADPDSFIG